MQNLFECKIKYEKTLENGKEQKVTEPYLVDAMSFTEAESRIIQEVTPFISNEYTVTDIKRAKINELVLNEKEKDDRYFKCKLIFITLDEKNGKEKKTSSVLLVKAADLRTAVKYADEHMKGSMADYQIASVTETAYLDVYLYKSDS